MAFLNNKLVKLTLLALAGVAMLIGLGTWQLQRLAWKQALMEKAQERATADPVRLRDAVRLVSEKKDIEYLRVRLAGRFEHALERHLYTIVEGKPGWRIVTPVRTTDGAIVMVDSGFVPNKLKDAAKRVAGQVGGDVSITGLARAPGRPNQFTPKADPDRNIWYWRDLEGMAATVLTPSEVERVVPFFVEADKLPVPGGWPRGGVTRVKFTNRHLEYAVTWYGLALALLLVYGAIIRRWRIHGEFT